MTVDAPLMIVRTSPLKRGGNLPTKAVSPLVNFPNVFPYRYARFAILIAPDKTISLWLPRLQNGVSFRFRNTHLLAFASVYQ